MRALPTGPYNPNLLVGTETSDDAGVFRIGPDLALVQTLDFFPPLVDDPFLFGQIAAANALSDIFAMNGRPITAMNIVAFPDNELPYEVLAEILRGAALKVVEAGAVTLGGHSVRDAEVKFGLSVTGLVDPGEVLTNAGARVGDVLVLTKPLGTGFINTANKKGEADSTVVDAAITSMVQLNVVGRDAVRAVKAHVHALTDVTGYGLAGHASEMADGAGVTLVLDSHALPIIEGAKGLALARYHSRASHSNREFLKGRIRIEETADAVGTEFAFDPQTSGGLLIAVAEEGLERLISELKSQGALASEVVGRAVLREDELALILT